MTDTASLQQWQPGRYKKQECLDLRFASISPKGYKDITVEKHQQMVDSFSKNVQPVQIQAMNIEKKELEPQKIQSMNSQQATKRHSIGVGKVSGRPWKAAASRALKTNHLPQNYEERKVKEKEEKLFKQQRSEAIKKLKLQYKEAKQRKELAKEKKQENIKKSQITQKISKESTIKKMLKSKNQRKHLIRAV